MACSKVAICMTCLNNDKKSTPAKYRCDNCGSYYCGKCSDDHRKVAKRHSLLSFETEMPKNDKATRKTMKCEECKNCDGESFCISCKKNYCLECKELHKQQHTPQQSLHSHSDATGAIKLCFSCKQHGGLSICEKICVGCINQLCGECFDVHQCSNTTRKMGFFIKTPFCEPCDALSLITTSTVICQECTEFMCDCCWKKHVSMKKMNTHKKKKITVSGKIMQNNLLCEPCVKNEKQAKAVCNCVDCEELLCNDCSNQHMTFKRTKDHTVTKIENRQKHRCNQETQTNSFERSEKETETIPTEESISDENHKPGKPVPAYIGIDTVTLKWTEAVEFTGDAYYQVSYREAENGGKWRYSTEEVRVNNLTICHLRTSTAYEFRVRVVYEVGDGPFSPISDKIFTKASIAGVYRGFSTKISDGNPSPDVYALPLEEQKHLVNTKAKARAFEIGKSEAYNSSEEKTILLFGTGGCGKTAAIDGLLNYALGVQWDDNFRFTVKNTLKIHREWINRISVNPSDSCRLHRRINIVCVPSFGVSSSLKRDLEIVDQLHQYLLEMSPYGLEYLDAVYFVVKSSESRLSEYQQFVFRMVLSLLGKDLRENVFLLCTFSDCKTPRVVKAVKDTSLPINNFVCINNAALFEGNRGLSNERTVRMFWNAGLEMYCNFIHKLNEVKTQNLKMTKHVLDLEARSKKTYEGLCSKVESILDLVHQLYEVQNDIDAQVKIISENGNYEIVDFISVPTKQEITTGSFALNCERCKKTCLHDITPLTTTVETLSVFDAKKTCKECKTNCHSFRHKIETSVYIAVDTKQMKIDEPMKALFDNAESSVRKLEARLTILSKELEKQCDSIKCEEDKMHALRTEIEKESLLPKSRLSKCEEIDFDIEFQKEKREEGFVERIKELKKLRKYSELTSDLTKFENDARSVIMVTGKKHCQDASVLSIFANFAKLFEGFWVK